MRNSSTGEIEEIVSKRVFVFFKKNCGFLSINVYSWVFPELEFVLF